MRLRTTARLLTFFADDNDGAGLWAAGSQGFNRQNSASIAVYTLLINTGDSRSLAESVGGSKHQGPA